MCQKAADDTDVSILLINHHGINYCLLLFRDEPSKTDVDVLRAVEGSPITPENHPHVHQWRNVVLAFSEQARKR